MEPLPVVLPQIRVDIGGTGQGFYRLPQHARDGHGWDVAIEFREWFTRFKYQINLGDHPQEWDHRLLSNPCLPQPHFANPFGIAEHED